MYMMNRLNINGFFTIPVLQKKIENMEDFNKSIVDNIDVFMKENENKKPVNWACELYVSGIHDNLLNRKEFRELKKPILENAKVLDFLRSWCLVSWLWVSWLLFCFVSWC